MKPKAHDGFAFGSKLLHPCRKLLPVFRLRKKLAIRRARASPSRATSKRPSHLKRLIPISAIVSVVRSLKKKMNARGRLKDGKAKNSKIGKVISASSVISDSGCERLLFPSPITPAASSAIGNAPSKSFKRRDWDSYGGGSGAGEVEDACRSFENYLVGMIAEEGKVKDLMDVEELLFCWKNLKCPVFIGLVSRFYGELCRDLFAATDDEDDGASY